MKGLDGDSLFSIFDTPHHEVFEDSRTVGTQVSNFIVMGTVIRGVENYFLIDQLYANRYKDRYFSVRDSLRLKYFIQLVDYLQRVKEFDSKTASMLLDEFGVAAIVYAFQHLLTFLEELEMYERCILVKKYLDIFLEDSLLD